MVKFLINIKMLHIDPRGSVLDVDIKTIFNAMSNSVSASIWRLFLGGKRVKIPLQDSWRISITGGYILIKKVDPLIEWLNENVGKQGLDWTFFIDYKFYDLRYDIYIILRKGLGKYSSEIILRWT